jgi:hypothetical protein
MLRIGFGKNKGTWFFRIDLWWKGYRFKRKKEKGKQDKEKVTCIVGDKNTGKIIINNGDKIMEIPAVVFSHKQSNQLLKAVDKTYENIQRINNEPTR